jgi:atypical dual specificity phosphatase
MSVDDANLHFVWIEQGRLAVSGFPEQEMDVQWLHDQGIRAIITLTEQALTYCFIRPDLLEALDIVNHHEPIDNRGVPDDLDAAYRVMEFVDEMLTERRPVLIHCWNGTGRTGVMLYTYFLQQNISLVDTRYHIAHIRPSSAWETLTPDQRDYIEQFDAHLHEP